MKVFTNTSKTYDLIIDRDCTTKLTKHLYFNYKKIVILTEENIPNSYITNITQQLPNAHIIILAKNQRKTDDLLVFQEVIHQLANIPCPKHSCIINIGGEWLCSMGGFVACTYLQGVEYINIPTTASSQIYPNLSAIVGIDQEHHYNLISTVYYPKALIIDSNLLNTLADRYFYDGLYKALQIGLLYDSRLVKALISDKYRENIEDIIQLSIKYQLHLINQKTKNSHVELLPSYGQPFANYLNSLSTYQTLLSGESLMHGMMIMCNNQTVYQQLKHLANYWQLPDIQLYNWELLKMTISKVNDLEAMPKYIVLNDYQKWLEKRFTHQELLKKVSNYAK